MILAQLVSNDWKSHEGHVEHHDLQNRINMTHRIPIILKVQNEQRKYRKLVGQYLSHCYIFFGFFPADFWLQHIIYCKMTKCRVGYKGKKKNRQITTKKKTDCSGIIKMWHCLFASLPVGSPIMPTRTDRICPWAPQPPAAMAIEHCVDQTMEPKSGWLGPLFAMPTALIAMNMDVIFWTKHERRLLGKLLDRK